MKSRLKLENEDWGPPLDPLTEASLLPEVHKQSLFFRVASRREDYFSDVEAISQIYDIEDVPTPHAGDFVRAIYNAPTQPDMASVEKQPTWRVSLTNRSTLILPHMLPGVAHIESLTTAPLLAAGGTGQAGFAFWLANTFRWASIFAPALQAARSCSTCLRALLGKCWFILRSLQNTRKLPVTFPDC